MRGSFTLTQEEKDHYKPIIQGIIEELIKTRNFDSIDLTDFDELSPYLMWELLEELGWENTDYDSNGWEQDTWTYFTKKGQDFASIVLFSCGMTFNMSIALCDNLDEEELNGLL